MRVNWILAALVAAAPLGCVEDAPKGSEAKAAQPTTAPAPSERTAPALPPADRGGEETDDTDPIIEAAQIASARVADHEERIDSALTAMSEDLRTLSGKDYRAVDLSAEKLLALVQLLRKSGERVVEKYPKVKAEFAAIVKAGANVKVGYARAKESYLEKAEKETGDLKERYLALADLCDTFSRTNTGRTAKYAAFASDLDRAVAKVERHLVFLKDFEEFLHLDPATNGAKGREEFIATLNRFADQIIRFGDVLKQFRDKAREGAVSVKLRAEHDRAVAARVPPLPAPAAAVVAKPDAVAAAELPAKVRTPEPTPAAPPSRVEVAAATPVARYVPVSVTRCLPTLVPVTYYPTRGFACGCRYSPVVTRYEWRNTLVTETHYVALAQ